MADTEKMMEELRNSGSDKSNQFNTNGISKKMVFNLRAGVNGLFRPGSTKAGHYRRQQSNLFKSWF